MEKTYTIKEARPSPDIYRALRRTDYTWKAAICDIIDNSIDAITQRRDSLSNAQKRDYVGEIYITIKVNKLKAETLNLTLVDNGVGVSPAAAPGVFSLGQSKKGALTNSLGVFGMGLKAAGLAIGSTIEFVSRTHHLENFVSVEFDSDRQMREGNFNVRVSTQSPSSTTFIEEKIGPSPGTAVIITKIHSLPNGVTDVYSSLEREIARKYRYRLDKKSADYLPLRIHLGRGRLVDSSSAFDCLEYSTNPEETTWHFGGPNFQFEEINYNGEKIRIRCSHTKGTILDDDLCKRHAGSSPTLGAGIKGSYKQGVYFIRAGREICIDRSCFWSTSASISNFFVELQFEDTGLTNRSYIKTDFGKKNVIVDSAFAAFMKKTLAHAVKSVKSYKPVATTKNQDEVKENVASVFSSMITTPRADSHTSTDQQPGQTLSAEVEKLIEIPKLKRKYAGRKLDSFTAMESTGQRSNWEFREVEEYRSKDMAFWEDVDPDRKNTYIIVINTANFWVKQLLSQGSYHLVYSEAAIYALGNRGDYFRDDLAKDEYGILCGRLRAQFAEKHTHMESEEKFSTKEKSNINLDNSVSV